MPQIRQAAKTTKRKIGRPKNSSVDNAENILRISLELFSAQNYSSVTIKDIAGAVGVNASLIHYYFTSKEELFLSVVESTAKEAMLSYETIRASDASPRAVITLWIENHIFQFELMQKLIKISLDYSTTHDRNPRIDDAIHRFYAGEEEVLASALRLGMARGDFKPRNIAETITFISTFLDGSLIRAVMFPTQFNHRVAIHTMRDIVLDYLGAADD